MKHHQHNGKAIVFECGEEKTAKLQSSNICPKSNNSYLQKQLT